MDAVMTLLQSERFYKETIEKYSRISQFMKVHEE